MMKISRPRKLLGPSFCFGPGPFFIKDRPGRKSDRSNRTASPKKINEILFFQRTVFKSWVTNPGIQPWKCSKINQRGLAVDNKIKFVEITPENRTVPQYQLIAPAVLEQILKITARMRKQGVTELSQRRAVCEEANGYLQGLVRAEIISLAFVLAVLCRNMTDVDRKSLRLYIERHADLVYYHAPVWGPQLVRFLVHHIKADLTKVETLLLLRSGRPYRPHVLTVATSAATVERFFLEGAGPDRHGRPLSRQTSMESAKRSQERICFQ
jgi:hypothetical protein